MSQPASQTPTIDARDRLIVALDLPTVADARQMVEQLGQSVRFYKFGLTLQLAPGAEEFIQWLIASGKQVFLDYKYYDIPATLKKAVARATELGVSFLTIHGPASLIRGAVAGKGTSDLKLFTVTVLTALDADDMAEMGYTNHSVSDLVMFRAKKALEGGCDGVIASGEEASKIKQMAKDMSGKLLVVTPGIRQAGAGADDQKRRTTPAQAITAGADYLVVGRPITEPDLHPNPKVAAESIVQEMQAAFDAR